MSDDLDCPYCGKGMEICHDDRHEEDVIYEEECPHCEKNFVFTISYSINHYPAKADCLNGAEHRYKPTITYPKEFSRLRCEDCGHEKPMPKVESGVEG